MSSRDNEGNKYITLTIIVLAILCAEVFLFALFKVAERDIKEKVILEAGSKIEAEMFFNNYNPDQDKLVSDIKNLDTREQNLYKITISSSGVNYISLLEIKDTVAPTAKAVPQEVLGPKSMDASSFVTDIYDINDVEVNFKEEPDFETAGEKELTILLSDKYGNSSEVIVPVTVIIDKEAPIIKGAKDLEYYIDEKIIYRNGIEVTDDLDLNPILNIDTSKVDVTKVGTYPVTYVATDASGNETRVEVNITISNKPDDYVSHEKIYKLAQKVLDKIVTDDMTDTEKAFHIFSWMWHNVRYVGFHDEMSWEKAAYDGFRTHKGNCFTFYSMCKTMLDMEGIPNKMVSRYPIKKWPHYWNLVYLEGEWYHCDSNPYAKLNYFLFMRTDKELDHYREFDSKNPKYPKRATKSVQSRLDFKKLTIRDE